MDQQTKVVVFFATWALLGLASFLLFFRSKADPKAKRRRIVVMNAALPVFFCGFVYWISDSPKFLILVAPFAAVIAITNIRIMKVCEKCGAVQMKRSAGLQSAKFCSQCGAAL